MKKALSLILCAALLLSLPAACRPSADTDPAAPPPELSPSAAPAETALPCAGILTSIWAELDLALPDAERYGFPDGGDPEQQNAYIQGAYGLEAGEWEDAAIARETGISAVELAVLRFSDEDAAQHR